MLVGVIFVGIVGTASVSEAHQKILDFPTSCGFREAALSYLMVIQGQPLLVGRVIGDA